MDRVYCRIYSIWIFNFAKFEVVLIFTTNATAEQTSDRVIGRTVAVNPSPFNAKPYDARAGWPLAPLPKVAAGEEKYKRSDKFFTKHNIWEEGQIAGFFLKKLQKMFCWV